MKYRIHYSCIVTLVLAFGGTVIPAAATAGPTLTLNQALESALGHNPTLGAAQQRAAAAHARPPQAATPPDPNFMVQFTQVPINSFDVDRGMTTYMVQQQIPFPGKLVYGYKAEKRAAEAADFRTEATGQEVVRRVTLAYLDVYRFQEEARIEHRTLAVYRTSKEAAETAYASEEGGLADPVRAAVDMGDIEARLALIEQDRLTALAVLESLMAAPLEPITKVAAPARPSTPAALPILVERAKAARPEIKEAGNLVRASDARVGLAKSHYGPDLTLRWGYDDRPNMQNAWTGRVMVSVPLWSLSKQRFGVRESKAMLKRSKAMNEETILATEADVRSTYARYSAASKRVQIYSGTVVPRARTLLNSSREGYQAGSGDFLNVVDSIRSLRRAELDLVRARIDHGRAYADLERAVGASPAKHALSEIEEETL